MAEIISIDIRTDDVLLPIFDFCVDENRATKGGMEAFDGRIVSRQPVTTLDEARDSVTCGAKSNFYVQGEHSTEYFHDSRSMF
jgi:hypothetical protein